MAGAVIVVNDMSDVEAYLADAFVAHNGTGGSGVRIAKADQVWIHANNDTDVQASTLGAAAGIVGSAGAGVTIIDLNQDTNSRIGDWALAGDLAQSTPTVGRVDVTANSNAAVGEFEGTGFMSAAIGVGGVTVSAGYTDVEITRRTNATVGDDVTLAAASEVKVDATAAAIADVTVQGLAAGLVGVGAMIGIAEVDATTMSKIEGGVVRAGSLRVLATDNSLAGVTVSAAAGGIASGNGADATANATSAVSAIVDDVDLTVADFVDVIATSNSEADALAEGLSIGGLTVGVSLADVVVTPTVEAYIGAGSVVVAGGDVTVQALSGKAAVPLDDQIEVADVSLTSDTITVVDHGLRDGRTVQYSDPDHDNAIGQPVSGREYHVLVVDDDTIQLGDRFDSSSGVQSATDTIRFSRSHLFQDGDEVVYSHPAANHPVGGLTNGCRVRGQGHRRVHDQAARSKCRVGGREKL